MHALAQFGKRLERRAIAGCQFGSRQMAAGDLQIVLDREFARDLMAFGHRRDAARPDHFGPQARISAAPSSISSPLVDGSAPAIASTRLLLPAPLAPSSAVIFPGAIVRSTSCSTALPPRATSQGFDVERARSCRLLDDAEIGGAHLWIGQHFGGRPIGDARAEIQHQRRDAGRRDQVDIMVDQQHLRAAMTVDAP